MRRNYEQESDRFRGYLITCLYGTGITENDTYEEFHDKMSDANPKMSDIEILCLWREYNDYVHDQNSVKCTISDEDTLEYLDEWSLVSNYNSMIMWFDKIKEVCEIHIGDPVNKVLDILYTNGFGPSMSPADIIMFLSWVRGINFKTLRDDEGRRLWKINRE